MICVAVTDADLGIEYKVLYDLFLGKPSIIGDMELLWKIPVVQRLNDRSVVRHLSVYHDIWTHCKRFDPIV